MNKQMKPKYQIVEQIINHCFKDSNYFNNLFSFFATLDFSIERHYDKEDDEHYGFMKLDLTTYKQYKLFYTSDPDLQLLDKELPTSFPVNNKNELYYFYCSLYQTFRRYLRYKFKIQVDADNLDQNPLYEPISIWTYWHNKLQSIQLLQTKARLLIKFSSLLTKCNLEELKSIEIKQGDLIIKWTT